VPVKITETQRGVLREMLESKEPVFRPRATLERLAKKRFVLGDRHYGWVLSDRGRAWSWTNLQADSSHSS